MTESIKHTPDGTYEVQVQRRVIEYTIIEVVADSPESAKRKAIRQVKDGGAEWCDGRVVGHGAHAKATGAA